MTAGVLLAYITNLYRKNTDRKGPGVLKSHTGPLNITIDEDIYSCGSPALKL